MPHALIALGSNSGDRAAQMSRAVDEISRSPDTRLLARSAWHATPPVGGPAGQGPFLNGCVRVSTSLEPLALFAELQRIETVLGRVRTERWGARTLDLDLLLYGPLEFRTPELTIPHPRMSFRRFVLEPAAEVAPWMVHAESGWTVASLFEHLVSAGETIAVADDNSDRANWLIRELAVRSVDSALEAPSEIRIEPWQPEGSAPVLQRPKLTLAPEPAAGVDSRHWRRMLHLPASGPVAWITRESAERSLDEALAALDAVWPRRAP